MQNSLSKLGTLMASLGSSATEGKSSLAGIASLKGGQNAFRAIASIHKACLGDISKFQAVVTAVRAVLEANEGGRACFNLYDAEAAYGDDLSEFLSCAKLAVGNPGGIAALKVAYAAISANPERKETYVRLASKFSGDPSIVCPRPAQCLAQSTALYSDTESFEYVAKAYENLADRANPEACWLVCQYCLTKFGSNFLNRNIFERLVSFLVEMGPGHDFINISSIPARSKGDVEEMFRLLQNEAAKSVRPSDASNASSTIVHSIERDVTNLIEIPDVASKLSADQSRILDGALTYDPLIAVELAMRSKNAQVRAAAVTKIGDLNELEKIANVEKSEIVCSSLRNANLPFAKSVSEALKNRSDELSRLDAEGKISVDETGGYSRADKNFAETFLSAKAQQVLRITKLVEANIPDEY